MRPVVTKATMQKSIADLQAALLRQVRDGYRQRAQVGGPQEEGGAAQQARDGGNMRRKLYRCRKTNAHYADNQEIRYDNNTRIGSELSL